MCLPSGDMLKVGLVDAHAKCSRGIKSFSSAYELSEKNDNIINEVKSDLKRKIFDLFIIKFEIKCLLT